LSALLTGSINITHGWTAFNPYETDTCQLDLTPLQWLSPSSRTRMSCYCESAMLVYTQTNAFTYSRRWDTK